MSRQLPAALKSVSGTHSNVGKDIWEALVRMRPPSMTVLQSGQIIPMVSGSILPQCGGFCFLGGARLALPYT
jgi:hypothetical protein